MRGNFTVIVKTTNRCNLRCLYCYHGESDYTNVDLSLDKFEKMVALCSKENYNTKYIMHGGEPLLRDANFYKEAIEICQKLHKQNKTNYIMNIQSNLTTDISDEMISIIKENNMKVGTSFDGSQNEILRGKTDKFLTNLRRLQDNGIETSNIFIVNKLNYKYIMEDLEYMIDELGFMGFSPHIIFNYGNYLDNEKVLHLDSETNASIYMQLFEWWWFNNPKNISIRFVENAMLTLITGQGQLCDQCGICMGKFMGISPDGNLFPCGRWYKDEHKIGHVNTLENINDAYNSVAFKNILESSKVRRKKCEACDVYSVCKGNCDLVHSLHGDISEAHADNETCKLFKNFYPYVQARLPEIKEKFPYIYDEKMKNLTNKLKRKNGGDRGIRKYVK